MKPEEEIHRGNEAAIVLGNPVYQEAMQVMRGKMMKNFRRRPLINRKNVMRYGE